MGAEDVKLICFVYQQTTNQYYFQKVDPVPVLGRLRDVLKLPVSKSQFSPVFELEVSWYTIQVPYHSTTTPSTQLLINNIMCTNPNCCSENLDMCLQSTRWNSTYIAVDMRRREFFVSRQVDTAFTWNNSRPSSFFQYCNFDAENQEGGGIQWGVNPGSHIN